MKTRHVKLLWCQNMSFFSNLVKNLSFKISKIIIRANLQHWPLKSAYPVFKTPASALAFIVRGTRSLIKSLSIGPSSPACKHLLQYQLLSGISFSGGWMQDKWNIPSHASHTMEAVTLAFSPQCWQLFCAKTCGDKKWICKKRFLRSADNQNLVKTLKNKQSH